MRQLARSVVAEHPLLRREELTKSGHYYSAWEVTVAKKRVGYYTTEAEAASAFFRLTFEHNEGEPPSCFSFSAAVTQARQKQPDSARSQQQEINEQQHDEAGITPEEIKAVLDMDSDIRPQSDQPNVPNVHVEDACNVSGPASKSKLIMRCGFAITEGPYSKSVVKPERFRAIIAAFTLVVLENIETISSTGEPSGSMVVGKVTKMTSALTDKNGSRFNVICLTSALGFNASLFIFENRFKDDNLLSILRAGDILSIINPLRWTNGDAPPNLLVDAFRGSRILLLGRAAERQDEAEDEDEDEAEDEDEDEAEVQPQPQEPVSSAAGAGKRKRSGERSCTECAKVKKRCEWTKEGEPCKRCEKVGLACKPPASPAKKPRGAEKEKKRARAGRQPLGSSPARVILGGRAPRFVVRRTRGAALGLSRRSPPLKVYRMNDSLAIVTKRTGGNQGWPNIVDVSSKDCSFHGVKISRMFR